MSTPTPGRLEVREYHVVGVDDQGVITPRFIPACTDAMLEGLGELAAGTGAIVQTRCSENDWEHQYVLDRFGVSDSVALERFAWPATTPS